MSIFKNLFDKKKPNGTPRKIPNFNLARKYGWRPNSLYLRDLI